MGFAKLKQQTESGARLLNILPPDIKCGDAKTLKKRLLKWMFEDPVYNMEDSLPATKGDD